MPGNLYKNAKKGLIRMLELVVLKFQVAKNKELRLLEH
jgi:hypothetical protein